MTQLKIYVHYNQLLKKKVNRKTAMEMEQNGNNNVSND